VVGLASPANHQIHVLAQQHGAFEHGYHQPRQLSREGDRIERLARHSVWLYPHFPQINARRHKILVVCIKYG